MAKKASVASVADTMAELSKEGVAFGYVPKEQKFFSSSNVGIDWATGGGLPVGKIVEISGKSGSGKTTLAIQTAVSVQEAGIGKVVWADYERAFDAEYAQQLGLNIFDESFVYFKPDSLEQGGDIIAKLVKSGEVALVIVDSTARMTSIKELEGSMTDTTVADKAKALYKFCRTILNALDDNNCTLIFLNHLLEAINTSMPGVVKKITPGGNAVPYFASLRIQCTVVKSVAAKSADAKFDAVEVEVLVTKNRVAPPFRKTVVRNDFGSGFSQVRSALEMAKELNIVSAAGAWTKINNEELKAVLGKEQYNGFDNFVLDISQNAEARGLLISLALEAIRNNK